MYNSIVEIISDDEKVGAKQDRYGLFAADLAHKIVFTLNTFEIVYKECLFTFTFPYHSLELLLLFPFSLSETKKIQTSLRRNSFNSHELGMLSIHFSHHIFYQVGFFFFYLAAQSIESLFSILWWNRLPHTLIVRGDELRYDRIRIQKLHGQTSL